MTSRRKTIGRKDFPNSKRNSWIRITNSRGGIMRVFPPKSLCMNWVWITLPKTSKREGSIQKMKILLPVRLWRKREDISEGW